MNDLRFEFEPEEKDSQNPLKSVYGVAYSGQPITQPWEEKPIIIDLDGLQCAEQIPLLLSHENHPSARLGVVQAVVVDGKLLVDGMIDTTSEDGKKIAELGKNIAWQLSIGARVIVRENVNAEPVTVNGREVADCVIVRKSVLREVSVVAVGADSETSLLIAAALNLNNQPSINKEEKMKELEEMRAKEAQRIADVTAALCNHADICKTAIAENWTKGQAESVAASLNKATANLAPATVNIINRESNKGDIKAIEAALEMRAGIKESEISQDERILEAAYSMRDISLKEVAAECLRIEGKTVKPHFDNEMVRAAFSTASLPTLLGNVANKKIKQAFTVADPVAPRLCVETDLNDYKLSQRANLNDLGDLQKIEDGQEIPDGVLGETSAYNQVESYAEIIKVGHKMLINDELGEFLRLPEIMGKKAALMLDRVYFARLLSNPTQPDGVALFASGHGNYMTGSASALSKDALLAAKAMLSKQVDKGGNPIAVSPKFLVVPSELEGQAQELALSSMCNGSTTANKFVPTLNVASTWGLEVVASPYLSNSNYAGNSATGWYLIADPAAAATMEIAYLRGQRVPTVSQADAPFNYLGLQFRVNFDFGIREQDCRGWIFAKGTE